MKSLPLKKIFPFFKYLIIHPICPQIWLGFAPVSQCGSVIVDIPEVHLAFWEFSTQVALTRISCPCLHPSPNWALGIFAIFVEFPRYYPFPNRFLAFPVP